MSEQEIGCGCWTDASGYWRLSDECRRQELSQWQRAMDAVPEIVRKIRSERMDQR